MQELESLVELSRELGRPEYGLAILAEGNASIAVGDGTFWVKASGTQLHGISAGDFVRVHVQPVVDALTQTLGDADVREVLRSARVETGSDDRMPSVETFMHAWLLTLPGVKVVGHVHPTSLLSVLCTVAAEREAGNRYFPDEVVCTGPASAYVPYVDPGLPLAVGIARSVTEFMSVRGEVPRTIWLANHGVIALGETTASVLSSCRMSEKAAQLRQQAFATGLLMRPLSSAEIARIHTRPDEHYRQAILWAASQRATAPEAVLPEP
jgi:rhamnose utilization protein RhaD (predicted bifunctional aldolase and dehydrogenase)